MTSGFHTGITRSETLHARLPQTVLLPCLASSVSFFFNISLILTRCRHRVGQVLLSQRLFMPGCPRLPSSMSSPLFSFSLWHYSTDLELTYYRQHLPWLEKNSQKILGMWYSTTEKMPMPFQKTQKTQANLLSESPSPKCRPSIKFLWRNPKVNLINGSLHCSFCFFLYKTSHSILSLPIFNLTWVLTKIDRDLNTFTNAVWRIDWKFTTNIPPPPPNKKRALFVS